jgi:hypothetical protein
MLSGKEGVLCEGTSLLFGPRMSALWSLQIGGHIDNKNIFCLYEIFYITTVNTCIKSLHVTGFDIILCLEYLIHF